METKVTLFQRVYFFPVLHNCQVVNFCWIEFSFRGLLACLRSFTSRFRSVYVYTWIFIFTSFFHSCAHFCHRLLLGSRRQLSALLLAISNTFVVERLFFLFSYFCLGTLMVIIAINYIKQNSHSHTNNTCSFHIFFIVLFNRILFPLHIRDFFFVIFKYFCPIFRCFVSVFFSWYHLFSSFDPSKSCLEATLAIHSHLSNKRCHEWLEWLE